MKKILIVLVIVLLIPISCKAQFNKLNDTELFDGIKFNNAALGAIMETSGNLAGIRTLLGNDIQFQANDTGFYPGKDFWNDNIVLGFEDEERSGEFYLTRVRIENSTGMPT